MSHMNCFFVDAETDGLYGRFLSIAAMVTDAAGRELDRFYAAIPVAEQELQSPWVKEHVFPLLSKADTIMESEDALLEAFWAFWMKHRETAVCIAYVPYPVESRLFLRCVMADAARREFLAPFPLYDLATLLTAKGLDPNGSLQALSGLDLPSHDALSDVIMTAAVWFKLMP